MNFGQSPWTTKFPPRISHSLTSRCVVAQNCGDHESVMRYRSNLPGCAYYCAVAREGEPEKKPATKMRMTNFKRFIEHSSYHRLSPLSRYSAAQEKFAASFVSPVPLYFAT